ncbi:MAG: hypothetical protein K1X56_00735 [Flavobacteriales bacterium]|nr:hypothetical protein [Flavobacteriales bacterium]
MMVEHWIYGIKSGKGKILLLAFFLRLLWLLTLPHPENSTRLADSEGYIAIAQNIMNGNTYSMSVEEPYYPDVFRTPLYPLFLILSGGQSELYFFTLVLQLFMSLWIIHRVMQWTEQLSANKKIIYLMGLLLAMDIPSIVFSTLVMTETLFSFLLIEAFYQWKQAFDSGRPRLFLWGSFLLGLAVLTRPILLYFPVLLSVFLLVITLRKKIGWRIFIYMQIPFYGMISLWMLRNFMIMGHWYFSCIGSFNMAYFSAAQLRSEQEHISLNEARHQLFEEAHQHIGKNPYEYPLEFYGALQELALREIKNHPSSAIYHALGAELRLWFYPMRGYLLQQRSGEAMQQAWRNTETDPFTFLLIIVQELQTMMIWTGVVLALFSIKNWLNLTYFTLLILPLIYAFITGSGAEMEARFRIPWLPFLLVLAALGYYHRVMKKGIGAEQA